MPIEFPCQQCGKQLRTADDTAGKMARCPACGNVQPIPAASRGAPAFTSRPNEPFSPGKPPSPAGPAPYKFADDAGKGVSPFGQPAKPNPFAETATPFNPYAAPSYPGAFQAPGRDEAYARNKVQGPAIALMATFGIAVAIYVVALGLFVVRAVQGNADPMEFAQFVVSLPLSIFVFYGANKMRRLEQHGVAVAAAICAMIPCTGCCFLGIPFGIWALTVLNDSYVRGAFRS
jgi:hypothetical protein